MLKKKREVLLDQATRCATVSKSSSRNSLTLASIHHTRPSCTHGSLHPESSRKSSVELPSVHPPLSRRPYSPLVLPLFFSVRDLILHVLR